MEIQESGVLKQSTRYFFTPSSFAERVFLYPTRVGHYFCNRHYRFHWRCDTARQPSHRCHYMLMLIKQGALQLSLENAPYAAGPRQLALFDCKQPHEYAAAADGLEFYWLLFNGFQAETIYRESLVLHDSNHVFYTADPGRIQLGLLRLLTAGAAVQRPSEAACSEEIYAILCRLLTAGTDGADGLDELIRRAAVYMDQNCGVNLPVETIAARVGLSGSYFTKQFRLRTGCSPHEYLTLRRIDRAKELLLASALTVKQIAFELGYNSEENFIRAFKKKVGATPSLFRRYPI